MMLWLRSLLCSLVLVTSAAAQDFVIRPSYEFVGHFHEGAAPVLLNNRWGLISKTGGWIVEPRYQEIRPGSDGRFTVRDGALWGVIDTRGQVIVPPTYDSAGGFKGGVAAVQRGGLWGYISPDGRVETGIQFIELGPRKGLIFAGRLPGSNGSPWELFEAIPGPLPVTRYELDSADPSGKTAWWTWRYALRDAERVASIGDGKAVVVFPDGMTELALDREYPQIPNWRYKVIRPRSEGWAAAETLDGVWGYIDETGNFLSMTWAQGAREFVDGVAPVKWDGKWGFVDRRGNTVAENEFDRAYSLSEGYATVRIGNKRGFLRNNYGRMKVHVWPTFEDVYRVREGLAPAKMGGKWGFVSAPDDGFRGQVERSVVEVVAE